MSDPIRDLIRLAHEADGELSAIYHRNTYDREKEALDSPTSLRQETPMADRRIGSKKDRDHLATTLSALNYMIGLVEGLGHKVPAFVSLTSRSAQHQLEFVADDKAREDGS